MCLMVAVAGLGARAPAQGGLRQAEAEYREALRLAEAREAAAAKVADRLGRLRAEQRAALDAIDAAEARITLADLRLHEAVARAAAARRRLIAAQRPASDLLAGLATMARHPPLLALADRGDIDTLVRTRLLLQAILPDIRRRSAGLTRQVEATAGLADAARTARSELAASRRALGDRTRHLSELEQKLEAASIRAGGAALGAGDEALRAEETVGRLRDSQAGDRAMGQIATDLARGTPQFSGPSRPPLRIGPAGYRLPATATVIEGLGEVDSGGVRSRGLTLATPPGTAIAAPAAGVIRFAGPYQDFDGVVIINHGDGWTSVLTNVASPLKRGQRIAAGNALGRALGPIGIELLRGGRRYSPALIAGSSGPLSNDGKSS